MLTPAHVCGVSRSILGQPWRWRGAAADGHDEAFQPDDLIDQLLMARGVAREALEQHRLPTLRGFMPDPSLFRDMDKAAERLADAVEAGEPMTVFGDYDVDGATSAALLVRLLRGLGSAPGAYIPDRLMEGYGPSGEALVRLGREGARLIVTVDCGAQAFEALAMAREAGVDVIVVDHHKCASALPLALALVNPNRLDEAAEAAAHGHLAAVGMCFLLGAATLRVLRGRGFFASREEPRLIELARPGRARHRRRRRPAPRPQPGVRDPGAEGDGAAPQCRPRRPGRRGPADPGAELHRSRLGAGAADQRRRPGRQVGPRRAAADHRGSRPRPRRSRPSSTD